MAQPANGVNTNPNDNTLAALTNNNNLSLFKLLQLR